jgi:hypothetical protein
MIQIVVEGARKRPHCCSGSRRRAGVHSVFVSSVDLRQIETGG